MEGDTALHLATLGRQLHTVKLLISAKADVSLSNLEGYTALHFAAGEANIAIMKYLIDSGASTRDLNHDGHSPMAIAVCLKQGLAADFLLECDTMPLSWRDADGDTILHHAVRSRDTNIVHLLLGASADVSIQGTGGTPLELAGRLGMSLTIFKDKHQAELGESDLNALSVEVRSDPTLADSLRERDSKSRLDRDETEDRDLMSMAAHILDSEGRRDTVAGRGSQIVALPGDVTGQSLQDSDTSVTVVKQLRSRYGLGSKSVAPHAIMEAQAVDITSLATAGDHLPGTALTEKFRSRYGVSKTDSQDWFGTMLGLGNRDTEYDGSDLLADLDIDAAVSQRPT
eukprot:CAMPEP_0175937928 /NCGR_PEP_ID=MMETSP0108-20121206/22414_1 /TAXON_ID=195067 ORGANISM="Goniomonas pacifica, Strain CCMP1869" /NCGR_SAMPLE_ID=MMETSP0108 /ASSEMBLY_ACC=CAM_ASM_000204 /LENGTH=341 /DNA_ID=CAMNT_0017262125 /DNA_START=12 /DNA_END=1037 /DNA_ORIENTATION=-